LFSGEIGEQAVLDKYNVSRHLYNKWLLDDAFAEQFDKRIAASYRQSAAMIARYAPLAAAKLVHLTESDKPETARKACLDIISMHSPGGILAGPAAVQIDNPTSITSEPPQLSAQTAGRLLAVLAEEKQGQ